MVASALVLSGTAPPDAPSVDAVETVVQDVQGTASLRATQIAYGRRAHQSSPLWWQGVFTEPPQPEPDLWNQQPIPGTSALRVSARNWSRSRLASSRAWGWALDKFVGQAVLDTKQLNEGDGVDDPSWSFTPSGVPTLITLHISKSRIATLDAVSYGPSAMTLVISAGTGGKEAHIWKLENPPSGTQTVQLTTSGGSFSFVAETIAWTGTALSGATSGGRSSTSSSSTSTSTPPVTTGVAGDVVIDTLIVDASFPVTPGAGQTEQWDEQEVGNTTGGFGSTEPGAASVTMSASWTNLRNFAHVAINIKAAALPFVAVDTDVSPVVGTWGLRAAKQRWSVASRVRSIGALDDFLQAEADTWAQQPIPGTGALRGTERAWLRRAGRSIPWGEFIEGPLDVQPDTYIQPLVGTGALRSAWAHQWAVASQHVRAFGSLDAFILAEPDTWAQQPIPGTFAVRAAQRLLWARAARPQPWGDFTEGPIDAQPDTSTQAPVGTWGLRAAAAQRWARMARVRSLGSLDAFVLAEADTWTQQPIPGTSAIRLAARNFWRLASRPQPWGSFDDFQQAEPDSWVQQPILGTGLVGRHASDARARARAWTKIIYGSLDDFVLAEADTWAQQPIPGTAALRATARIFWQRAGRPKPWGSLDEFVLPEPDPWTQQPIPGTRSMQLRQRAWWARAARPLPWGDFAEGPVGTQPDTWQQPIPGTFAVRAAQRAWWARVARPLPWGDFTEGPVGAQPDTWIQQPIPGVSLIRQHARARIARIRAHLFHGSLDAAIAAQIAGVFGDWLRAAAREEIVLCEPEPSYTLVGFVHWFSGAYSVALPRFVQTDYVTGGIFAKCIGVTQNDTALIARASRDDVADLTGWYWDAAADLLYVKPTSGVPSSYTMLATRRLYFATAPVVLEQTASDPTTALYYHPWITGQLPTVRRHVEDLLSGSTSYPSGSVDFVNGHAAWFTLVAADGKWNWKYARVRFYLGGAYNGLRLTRAQYIPIATMLVEDTAPTETVCQMALLPLQRQTDLELPITPFFESAYPNLGAGVRGTKKWIGYGRATIPADLTDTSGLGIYTIADAASQTLFAINNVWAVAKSTGVRTLLTLTTHYTVNLTACTVTIVSATYPHADFDLHVDVTGKPDGLGSYLKTYSAIVRDLLQTFLGVATADLDTAAFTDAAAEADAVLALWIKSPRSLASLLATAEPEFPSLSRSVMGAIQQTAAGQWTVDIWKPDIAAISTILRREDFAVFEPQPKLRTIYSTVRVFHSYDHAREQWAVEEVTDLGVQYRTGSRDVLELYTYLTVAANAQSIGQRYLLLAGAVAVEAAFVERGALLAQFDARDKVAVTYTPAPTVSGSYTANPFEVLDLELSLAPKVTVRGRLGDLRGLGGRVGVWMDSAAPDWASSSATQRNMSGYWSDAAGKIDPGDPSSLNRSMWW